MRIYAIPARVAGFANRFRLLNLLTKYFVIKKHIQYILYCTQYGVCPFNIRGNTVNEKYLF